MTIPKDIKAAFENTPWLIPELAPKDKCFIGVFNSYPYPAQAHWNEQSQQWAYVMLQCDMVNGEWEDNYFQTMYADEENLVAWIPMEKYK